MYPSPERPVSGTFVQEQVESLRAAGAEVEVMAFDGARSFRNYIRAGMSLRKRVREQHYDVIHAHYGLTGLPARMQFACPIVLTYHGSDLLGQVGPDGNYTVSGRLKVLLSKLLGFTVNDRIIVASLLQTRWWKAHIIPMGVDMDLFQQQSREQARARLSLHPTRRYVLFVANPSNKGKRFDIAKEAVDLLALTGMDVEILPVFKVPHDQIPLYMGAADVLVLTSDHEASPCVIKEALASNLPIVSVRVGDVEERIAGVNGCFLCSQTPADVADKLQLALAHSGPTNGREAVKTISLTETARRTISVLEAATGLH
jgi:glycosyltransferase involved in cell wall biosynthesis